ncbi:MAG: bifunctional (p)ppGpp synthetase/guanosine-3',5'-bis(diphosphate) 3'-pyrophosphohydrolase [Gemmatimonadetes bacterium]|nr:bifunctional (p)ppGpp synthetase/guanosine-3',5'-bis(diphosphate) 3'-pyrophosphohydrolase [Gemmatimonadota bacterium]
MAETARTVPRKNQSTQRAVQSDADAPVHLDSSIGLDEVLEQAHDHLQLQMLLIEVASCDDQADFALIARAYHFAKKYHEGQTRKSGHPFLHHCVEVARLLAQLRMDHTTVAAGLLHDLIEDTPATYADIAGQFGDKIAHLIDGVTKIDQLTYESREARQAETYRKMLLSMVKDIRVMLIKLVDRLHNMRTLEHMKPETQERIAHETLEVYAPLAHRFGLARIRWELEDSSLKFLEPEIYQELREKVAMKRREREAYIEEFKSPIEEKLLENRIEAEFTGRAKNFFSIYNKMKARNKPFEEVYDLLAVRIITGTVRECYHILGLVHGIYSPIPERIKDYISTPKSNMYQSLHTSVIGPKGQSVEVQIRTSEMHHTAEIGIAAHWRYKSEDAISPDLDQHLGWLHKVIDWQQEATDPADFMANFKIELFQDEVFVFTPKGDLYQLPKGATPIDFAFSVHTDIGLHCLTAKVNGQVVPLNTPLGSGDKVHIVTNPHQKPNHSWLEFAKTTKAHQAIRRWLKEEQYDHSVRLGRDILDRELKRYRSDGPVDLDEIAAEVGLTDAEQLYAGLGSGDLSVGKIVGKFIPHKPKRRSIFRRRDRRGISIQGMQDLMISFGKCCTPIPGEGIIGLITRGRGVTVHRTDCPNMGEISEDPDRLLHVQWDLEGEPVFTVQLRTRSRDRKYLLSEISKAIGDAGSNIRSATTRTDGEIAEQDFWIDVTDIKQLRRTISQIKKIQGVLEVRRIDEPASYDPPAST